MPCRQDPLLVYICDIMWHNKLFNKKIPLYIQRVLVDIPTLQWRHNGRDSVWNHQPHDCLLNRIFYIFDVSHINSECSGHGDILYVWVFFMITLRWRHNGPDSVSNHQPHDWLLNRLFRRRSKKTSKLRVTGLCVGNSPGPVNSPHKGPVTRKMFPFDDVIMNDVYSTNPAPLAE